MSERVVSCLCCCSELLDATTGGVAEHLLHALLGGSPTLASLGIEPASHTVARAGLFGGNGPAGTKHFSRMLCESRFAAALTLRGYQAAPAFEGAPLQLCFAPGVAGTPRAAAALEKVRAALSFINRA